MLSHLLKITFSPGKDSKIPSPSMSAGSSKNGPTGVSETNILPFPCGCPSEFMPLKLSKATDTPAGCLGLASGVFKIWTLDLPPTARPSPTCLAVPEGGHQAW